MRREKERKKRKNASLAMLLYSNSIQKSVYVVIEIALLQQE